MQQYRKAEIVKQLVDFFGDDLRRIEHAFSVLKHAEAIAERKTGWDYEILVASALLHDVGIKPSEEKLDHNNGHTQEEYGQPKARVLLNAIDFPLRKTEKVCEIIGNHHSPSRYDYIELEILKEADRIVNSREARLEKLESGG